MNNSQQTPIQAWIDGVGILGPGISSWPQMQSLLRGNEIYIPQPTVLPVPELLPPAERRRAVQIVRLTMAAGLEAVAHAGQVASALPSIFSSSSGDGQNLHAICETLTSDEREISPTRFHNSVHNAASGYWSIATGATPTSTALCAFDGSFSAALLEAMAWLAVERTPILIIVYDVDYPEPLRALRQIPAAFCAALVLAPVRSSHSLARIGVRIAVDAEVNTVAQPQMENLRNTIPAARCLPLLDLVANARAGEVVLDYLEHCTLHVEVQL